jgi:hypothetical protein
MHKKITMFLFCSAAAGWIVPAAAQDIYRCGDSYSQQACPGGVLVDAQDPRSASQKSQASQAAVRDAKAADVMEKARLKDEAKPAQVLMPPPKAEEPAPEERTTVVEGKAKKPAYFTAVARKPGDGQPKKKKKKAKKRA